MQQATRVYILTVQQFLRDLQPGRVQHEGRDVVGMKATMEPSEAVVGVRVDASIADTVRRERKRERGVSDVMMHHHTMNAVQGLLSVGHLLVRCFKLTS